MFDDLYPRVATAMKPQRFLHSLGVFHTAVQLANVHGVDPRAAGLAGLLHDLRKDRPSKELKKQLKNAGWDHAPLNDDEKKIWHAWAGELSARDEFGIDDPAVTLAIRWHPTGHPEMDDLAKVIFVADYTEPGRRFRGNLAEIRKVSRDNLDAAVYLTLEEKTKYLDSLAGKCLHPWSLAALEHFRGLKIHASV